MNALDIISEKNGVYIYIYMRKISGKVDQPKLTTESIIIFPLYLKKTTSKGQEKPVILIVIF